MNMGNTLVGDPPTVFDQFGPNQGYNGGEDQYYQKLLMMNALKTGEHSSYMATPENEPILPRMDT